MNSRHRSYMFLAPVPMFFAVFGVCFAMMFWPKLPPLRGEATSAQLQVYIHAVNTNATHYFLFVFGLMLAGSMAMLVLLLTPLLLSHFRDAKSQIEI